MSDLQAPSPAVSVEGAKRWSPRNIMRIAIIVLFLAQCLPFSSRSAWVSHENEDPLTTRGGDDSHGTYHSGYVAEISTSGGEVGWQDNHYAVPFLAILVAFFYTRLYNRPGWNRWMYWVALVLVMGCTQGLIPPLSTAGGMVGAVALVMTGYAAWRNHTQRVAAV